MRQTDKEIVRLAFPAFLALVAEPLFLLADSAVVGHLGVAPLAGLGVAGAVLQTLVSLSIFLAYGTTAAVARRVGAGDLRGALTQGVDGCCLAVVIGVVVTALGAGLAGPLVRLLGAEGDTAAEGTTYLRIASFGAVPLLVMLATTGILRGVQDTRTPLVVAVAGNLLNVALNVGLVYGLDMGIAGSATGSVAAQALSALALVAVVVRAARRAGAPLRPDVRGVLVSARAGVPLVVRTLTLRAALLVTTYAVASGAHPETGLATHQLATTIWTFLSFVLDAVAIAAQALTGKALGEGDVTSVRRLTDRMVRWGWVSGIATGLLLAAASPVLGALFTTDADVRRLLVPVLLVAALGQPFAGVVFVLDGVLIGAGDGRYLALAGTVVLIVYAPVVLVAAAALGAGLVGIWVAFAAVFMGARLVVLVLRARGDQWLVTGSGAVVTGG